MVLWHPSTEYYSFRSTIHASSITSQSKPPNPKSTFPTLQADIKPRSLEKHFVPSSKDLSVQCNSMAETLVKKSRPSESSGTPSKSSTSSPEEILLKSSSMQSWRLVQDKTPPESELAVKWKSRQSMSHPWEELTRRSIYLPMEQETTPSKFRRPSPNVLPTKLSIVKRTTLRAAMLSRKKKKSKR